MPSYVTPKINTAYIFYTSLVSQSDTKLMQANPTLATGDVTVSTDGGSFANIETLPAVTPASGVSVKVSLSADEMNGDNIIVRFSDAAGSEWADQTISIQTTAQQIDDLATPATVWTNSTRTLTAIATTSASLTAGSIAQYRGDSWSLAITGLGTLTGYANVQFTIKDVLGKADTAALVQIDTDTGLVYINGAAATAGNGSITIDDASAGDITVALYSIETAKLAPGAYNYDVQLVSTDNQAATTLAFSTFNIIADVTRATA